MLLSLLIQYPKSKPMQAKISKMGGLLKSSFFSTLVFFNFILTVCFIVLLAYKGFQNVNVPKTEAIEQNLLPQGISVGTAQLITN
jgi:hypothetical protein